MQDFPPALFPPSFNLANIMQSAMDDYKTRKTPREGLVRAGSWRPEPG